MAGEGGKRHWWQFYMGVNVANGNLHFEFGQGSCLTCGGGSGGAYPNPQSTSLNGPNLVYNTLGANTTDLGPKWMLGYDAAMTVDGSGNVTLIDADGTQRVFTKNGSVFDAHKESAVLTDDTNNYYLTRFNGDVWTFAKSHLKLVSIKSRTTHEITLTRDGNNRITKITDGFGREIFLYYMTADSNTRLNEYREPAPGDVGFQSTFFFYDTTGRLIQITNPLGEITRFEYDGSDRLTKKIDGHGHETIYTYDGSSRVTSIEDAAGNDTVITYTSSTETKVTNRENEDTIYTLDSDKRVTVIKDALLNLTEFAYTSTTWTFDYILGPKIPVSGTPWKRQKTVFTYGNTTATQHEVKKKEVYTVDDGFGPPVLLSTEEWTFNNKHDVLTYKDPRGKTWTYTYKLTLAGASTGLVATEVNPNSQTTVTNTYGSEANKYRLESSTNGVSKTTSFAYNQNTSSSYGTPDKITQPSGAITNYKIDVRGRIYETKPPTGDTTYTEYDALDRVTRVINPDGAALETMFECCHVVATLDENERGMRYEYNKLGWKTLEIDADGNETSYTYDKEGRMLTMVNPRGKTTSYTLDDIGRVTQIDYPGGWQEIYTYFEPGMVKTKKSKKSTTETTITFEYDDLYRLTKKDFSSGTDTEFEYYENGLLKTMKDASGEKRYTYDDSSRLTKVEQGPTGFDSSNLNFTLEYTWNAASQNTQKKVTIRTQSAKTWDLAYEDDGQLNTVVNPDSETTNHDYLSDGRLKKITLSTASTREYFYQDTDSSHAYVANKNSHLRKTLDKKSGGDTICSFDYELDKAGNRLSLTDKDSKYTGYGMDPTYQLVNETKWSAKVPGSRELQYGYAYDPNGNRLWEFKNGTRVAYTYGDNDEMTAAGSITFSYDHFGNTATKVDGGTTTTYTWDNETHMTAVSNSSSTDGFEYDGSGRRMRARYNNSLTWTHFVHCELSDEILAEYTLVSGTFTIKALNTYGFGLISSNREGTKRYYHFDGLGSTRALTNDSQTVTDTYDYSAFGVQEASSGSSVNPFRYVGQWGYYADSAMGSLHGTALDGAGRYYLASYNKILRASSSTGSWPAGPGGPKPCKDRLQDGGKEGFIWTDALTSCADKCFKKGLKDVNKCFAACVLANDTKLSASQKSYVCCTLNSLKMSGWDPCDNPDYAWQNDTACCCTNQCMCMLDPKSWDVGKYMNLTQLAQKCENEVRDSCGRASWTREECGIRRR